MDPDQVSRFVALLSLAVLAATVAVLALALGARLRPGRPGAALDAVRPLALWFAAAVATGCMLGSLYYSEVAHDVPCELCWFQRICMYPLAATLVVAAIRRDRAVWRYVVVPASVGAVIATYHTQLQAFPDQASFCPTTVPCTIRYVWEFGFVSLPFMALTGFMFVLTMVALAAKEPAA